MISLKKEVILHLERGDYKDILSLAPSVHKIFNTLIKLSYDKSSLLAWQAIEAVGVISREIAKTEPETVRNLTGRLLWMIRDESGGIGWSSPEMLGEIVRNNPHSFSDVAPVIVSFHDETMLRAGVLWALGRMGKINEETAGYAIPIALQYLRSPDHRVRAYAAFALGELGALGAVTLLEHLLDDSNAVPCYENGKLADKSVGKFAEEALAKIKEGSGGSRK